MSRLSRESLYFSLARLSGLALVLVAVFFQRRGLMEWTELVFLGLCVGLQETFLRLPALRRWRTPMLVLYSMAPLILIVAHGVQIREHAGNLVDIVTLTPLPLVLVSVQIMVLYVRDAPRLVSVVLVLALFSAVIGVRRDDLQDALWPWLAAISGLAAVYLALQLPGMLYYGVYTRRAAALPPAGRPSGVLRRAFVLALPLLAVGVIAASMLLYFSVPRLDFRAGGGTPGGILAPEPPSGTPGDTPPPGSSRPTETPTNVAGLSDGVELGEFGDILRSGAPVMRVQALYPAQAVPDVLYLRAFTFADFDGERWTPLEPDPARVAEVPPGERGRAFPDAPELAGELYGNRPYELLLHEAAVGSQASVPLPVEAVSIHAYDGPLLYDNVQHTLSAPLIGPGDTLRVTAREIVIPRQELARRLAARLPPALGYAPEYARIPVALREQVIARFQQHESLRMLLYGLGDRRREYGMYAAADYIVRMFAEARAGDQPAWTYSLEQRPAPGADAIARFLDTSGSAAERVGHCEYFASAMCVLLRSMGVPCRMAAGYAARSVDLDNTWEVTSGDAHAWVEVYFSGYGWVAFDPTPGQGGNNEPADPTPEPTEEPEPDEPEPQVQAPEEPETPEAGGQERDWFREFDASDQRAMLGQAFGAVENAVHASDQWLLSFTGWIPDGLLPRSGWLRLLVLALPIEVIAMLLMLRRRKRRRIEKEVLSGMGSGGKQHDRGVYFQLLVLLAGHGFHKLPSETPREFARRVSLRGGPALQTVGELTEKYYAMRFGGNRELTAELRQAVQRLGDALKIVLQSRGEETDADTAPTQ